jgi:hypothetical protein
MQTQISGETKRTTVSKPFELHEQLVKTIGFSKQSFLVIGKLLHELKKKDLYKEAIGAGMEKWDDYLSQPEIGMTRGEANRLEQIYNEFVVIYDFPEQEIAEVPLKSLHYILPIAKQGYVDREEIEEMLEEARTLTQKDFRERMYERKNDTDERTYTYVVMKKCDQTGSLSKVWGVSSDEIKEKLNVEQTES